MTHNDLKEKVKLLPFAPGIYMMKDKNDKIIYVGKSKCLHNRVSHYFQPITSMNAKTAKLSANIFDFECIYTKSEAEALILENELIKRHNPKYNIKLKDAKTYPYIKLSYESEFPKITVSRTRNNDNSEYFGPYISTKNANDIVDTISKHFSVATCGKEFKFGKKVCRPCLSFHLGQCIGPCSGNVSVSEYSEIFSDIKDFLKGNYKSAINELTEKMNACAEKFDFENAAKYRDRISAINKLNEHQNIITDPEKEFDVFGLYVGETSTAITVIFIRNGKVIDKDDYIVSSLEIVDDFELSNFIERFYDDCGHIPKNILLSFHLEENELSRLAENLSLSAGYSVKIQVPERGEKKIYAEMAKRNASESVRQRAEAIRKDEEILVKLASLLKLEIIPQRIEAYDISNNGKDDIYAGMIVVKDARFTKKDYRTFSIKELSSHQDDYASMSEALRRRLSYLTEKSIEHNTSFSEKPDLILLDGGHGHVNAVKKVMNDMGIYIPVIGMVKDEFHKTRTLTDGECEISIAKDMSLFTFIYGIQEEVHRFTFSKMDASRNKKIKHSILENIKGIGPSKAKMLLKKFKSIQNIKSASVDELSKIPGINIDVAEKILQYLNKDRR